jgi:hypothetical protein
MTYLEFTYLPHLIQHVHTVLGKYYSPDEINDAMDRVQIEWADEIDTAYVVDAIRDEIPLLEDAD